MTIDQKYYVLDKDPLFFVNEGPIRIIELVVGKNVRTGDEIVVKMLTLYDSLIKFEDVINESGLLFFIQGHFNVVKYYGLCTSSFDGEVQYVRKYMTKYPLLFLKSWWRPWNRDRGEKIHRITFHEITDDIMLISQQWKAKYTIKIIMNRKKDKRVVGSVFLIKR